MTGAVAELFIPEGESRRAERRAAVAATWELVRAAQSGDAAAFGELYRRTQPVVSRYVRRRVLNEALAEDITSETFARALSGLHGLSYQGRDVAAWLQTIAANLIRDHFKSARQRREHLVHYVVEQPCLDSEVDAGLLRDEEARELLAAVARLNPLQRQCIELRFLRSKSVAETGEIMRRSASAVKVLTYRAVRNLAKILAEPTSS